jgi:L-fuculose-phosphate aldolase
MRDSRELRDAVIATALEMNALGINRGKSGNVSARIDNGFLVTPSGMPYADIAADDVVAMRHDGSTDAVRKPSSEWRFHRDIYASRGDANAIVHTHSRAATTSAARPMQRSARSRCPITRCARSRGDAHACLPITA